MMGKLQEMKQRVEETKKRLDTITIRGEAGDGAIIVIANGNREIKDIKINDELLNSDKEELTELLIVALNRALEQAEKINESEMQGAAKGFLPNIPGLM